MNYNRLGCLIYTPDNAPEMEIYYKVTPGQAQTFEQPVIHPEIDVCDIAINGDYVSERVYNSLVTDRSALESEIAEHLRKQADSLGKGVA